MKTNDRQAESHVAFRQAYSVRVRLSCGHWTTARHDPSPGQRYCCPMRQGCGYNLAWTEFEANRRH